MKTIKHDFGSLSAMMIKDADGWNIYWTNKITDTEHLFIRLEKNALLSEMDEAFDKIESSAKELNENFKQL